MAAKKKASAGASAPVLLKPSDILKHVENKTVAVFVPEWNANVECIIPSADDLFALRMEHQDKEEFQKALFKASLKGFTDEDVKLLEAGNGLKYFQLYTAVMNNTDLFTTSLSEKNLKK